MSPPFAVRTVWPASWISSSVSSPEFCFASSATLSRYCARSRPFMRGHGPSSNAVRAAAIARRASSAAPRATLAYTSPVEGSSVSNVLPSAASTSSPAISIWWVSVIFGCLLEGGSRPPAIVPGPVSRLWSCGSGPKGRKTRMPFAWW